MVSALQIERQVDVDAVALALQLSLVGAMVGSLYAPQDAVQNAFVAGGAVAGALVGWRASRASTAVAHFRATLVIGAIAGVGMLGPLALRERDYVLVASGASLGLFLAVPLFVLTLPAFHARQRAARARTGSILRRADAMASWAASGVSVALLGLWHQPVLFLGSRRLELSTGMLALAAVTGLAVVVVDVRAWREIQRLGRALAQGPEGSAPPPADVGMGADVVERREPPSNPFRSAEKVTSVTVGSIQQGRRALVRSLVVDGLTFVLCAASLAWRSMQVLATY
jgi:hypothetical protein